MCGICGAVGQQREEVLIEACRTMHGALLHRGPDGEGTYSQKGIALAHRRLALLDIKGGAQPMRREHLVAIYNGEIYNYRTLRSDLRQHGLVCAQESDTCTVLACHQFYGVDSLARYNGMFALAIWDEQSQTLLLARDRYGIKPLYYTVLNGTLYFASELQALLLLPALNSRLKLEPTSICDFLAFGYTLSPKTFYQDIQVLPPGTWAKFSPGDRQPQIKTFARLAESFLPKGRPVPSFSQAGRSCRQLLHESVSNSLRADAAIGTFLSGGMDSTAIASLLRDEVRRSTTAFTVGFRVPGFDERKEAAKTAALLGMPLEMDEIATISMDELAELFACFGEPFADTSLIPTARVSKLASGKVKAALSGDGGDELLAGYDTYLADSIFPAIAPLRFLPPALLAKVLDSAMQPRTDTRVSAHLVARSLLRSLPMSREAAHVSWRILFSPLEIQNMLSPELLRACAGYNPLEQVLGHFGDLSGQPFLNRAMYADMKTWLSDCLLRKVDLMSMRSSLEVRVPFLDNKLVDLLAPLPPSYKMLPGSRKRLLRAALGAQLPRHVLSAKKRGFNAPTDYLLDRQIDELPLPSWIHSAKLRLDPRVEQVTYRRFALASLRFWWQKSPSESW